MGGRRRKFRQPSPGLYILGEGITEQYYFVHLKTIFHYTCTIRPRLFCNTCIDDIESRIAELIRSDIHVICVFDADVSQRNKTENEKLARLRFKYRNNKNVIFAESLPSIEYWFLLHFRDTCRQYNNAKEVERDLSTHLDGYEKTEKYLKNENWVRDMSARLGDINIAEARAKKYDTAHPSYSKLYLALEKMKDSIT